MKKLLVVLLSVFLIGVLIGPAPLLAARHDGVEDALEQGADRMVSLQGTYGGVPNIWEWIIGSGISGNNILGISATGLVAAYEKTKDRRYLAAAIAAGNTLVARYNAAIVGGVTWDDRPYSQDVEFLAWLSRESKNPVYGDVAVKWHSIIPAYKTAAENVNRYISRGSLAGWDLASQIRAALAVGQKDYAKAVAAELIRRSADWVGNTNPYGDLTILSYASLLWALDQVGDNQEVISQYRSALLTTQETDGSWDGGAYQTTAYAILGLSANKGKDVKKALDSAGTFLVSSQADNGGWVYSDGSEYGEENSEVLMSLAALLKGGDITNIHKVKLSHKERGEHREKHKHMR